MANKYFTNKNDINDIVEDGVENSNYQTTYKNFKSSTVQDDDKGFKRPRILGYKINGVDISKYLTTSRRYEITSTQTYDITNYISVSGVIYGGGGGGGGGGGTAVDTDGVDTYRLGEDGQAGNQGAISWFTLDITNNTSMTVNIGNGGASGAGGGWFAGSAGWSNPGQKGTTGGKSSVTIDDEEKVYALGGRGGLGGRGRSTEGAYTTRRAPEDINEDGHVDHDGVNEILRVARTLFPTSYKPDDIDTRYGWGAAKGEGTSDDGKGGGGSENFHAGGPGGGGYAVIWFQ